MNPVGPAIAGSPPTKTEATTTATGTTDVSRRRTDDRLEGSGSGWNGARWSGISRGYERMNAPPPE
ncbi:hypothetical protein GCM10009851_33690 [Herbiconiux moechotypicola]|uniref:Uncharacterized protein n=1 Tax=Herbiconiux moechotypicola TaxID=637393 RepID=A0ABN3E036_9MICO